MNDFSPIIQYVSRYIQLTPEEEEKFTSLLRITKVKKRQFIVQPEFVCKYKSYVVKGSLRGYLIGNNGEEYTIFLAIEDWWAGDFNSFMNQTPATIVRNIVYSSPLLPIKYPLNDPLTT